MDVFRQRIRTIEDLWINIQPEYGSGRGEQRNLDLVMAIDTSLSVQNIVRNYGNLTQFLDAFSGTPVEADPSVDVAFTIYDARERKYSLFFSW